MSDDPDARGPGAPTLSPASWLVSAGRPAGDGAPLAPPLVASSTFAYGEQGPAGEGASYARGDGTPTWVAFEHAVGGLEGGEAVAFASGMAAVAACFDPLPVGAHVVLPDGCYQGVAQLADHGAAKGRWTVQRLPLTDVPAWTAAAAPAHGRQTLLWLESPSNPLLDVADLPALCSVKRAANVTVAVDNTFATPLGQRPLELGADLVVHSATKSLGGHSDLLLGVTVTRDTARLEALRRARALAGATPGALEAWLALRGLRTLSIRHRAACANALELATRLGGHPAVSRVRYPGLPGDPSHALAARALATFGSVLSFELADAASADRACRAVRLIRHATSLGAVESTMERRAALPGQEAVPAGLVRLSVGIEHVDDLWRDLAQALAADEDTDADG